VHSPPGPCPAQCCSSSGGSALLGILGIANGAVGVFMFVLGGLLVLPLMEIALPAARRGSLLVPVGAGA
jgi:hypothetical protein